MLSSLTIIVIAVFAALAVLVAGVVAFTARTLRRPDEDELARSEFEYGLRVAAGLIPPRPVDPARDRDELELRSPGRRSSLLLALAAFVILVAASTGGASMSSSPPCKPGAFVKSTPAETAARLGYDDTAWVTP